MSSNFAISEGTDRTSQRLRSTQQPKEFLSYKLASRACTCWRGNFRSSIACQTCLVWSKALTRMERQ